VGWGAPPNKVSVVLNAPDISNDNEQLAAQPEIQLPENTFCLVTSQGWCPRKASIRSSTSFPVFPTHHWSFIGDGQERENLELHARQLGVMTGSSSQTSFRSIWC